MKSLTAEKRDVRTLRPGHWIITLHQNKTQHTHIYIYIYIPPPPWRNSPYWTRASSWTRLHMIIHRRTTRGRSPLDDWSARSRDFYLITHKNQKRPTSMSSAGFEPTISASERPQTHTWDRAVAGIDHKTYMWRHIEYLMIMKHKAGNIKQACVCAVALITQGVNPINLGQYNFQIAKCISCAYLANYEL